MFEINMPSSLSSPHSQIFHKKPPFSPPEINDFNHQDIGCQCKI